MNVCEKLWKHYAQNTMKDLADTEGLYDLSDSASLTEDGIGAVIDFRELDNHYGYDFESVYGYQPRSVALYCTDELMEEVLTRAVVEKRLNAILDEMFPEWREDWEIPNHDAAHYVTVKDLMDEFQYVGGALDTFMEKFGFRRFFYSLDLWEDTSYQMPLYEDPNQLQLPFMEGLNV